MLYKIRTIFCMVGLLVGCGSNSTSNQAPEIETTLINGEPFRLSDLRGQYVVLDFWGSWCGPCLQEIPKLIKLHEKHGHAVAFVTIAFEKDDKRWRSVTSKAGFNWEYQIVEQARVLLASSIARSYGVTDIPAKFVVTPTGELLSGMDFNQMDAYLTASVPKN